MKTDTNEALAQHSILHGTNYEYVIERQLGQGSFGITYMASISIRGQLGCIDSRIKVAIKEFFMNGINTRHSDGTHVEMTQNEICQKYRERFRKEAYNLSKMRCDKIAKVLEVFDQNNTTYYVMEYVDGQTLDHYIASRGRLPESEAFVIFTDIVQAVGYMHEQKMLHLDIKPANIMLDNEKHIKLIDFGLSKQFTTNGEPESSTSIGLGTPGYAPVEQGNYVPSGTFPATLDIYALGATLYKMLCGSRPPRASEVLDGLPQDVLYNANISNHAIGILTKAMNPYRTKRYQNTRELLNAIERHDTPEYDGKDTVITPTDGISIFSILNDNSFIANYQGNVYRIPNGVVPNYDFDKFIFNTGSSPFKLIWDNVKLLKDRAVFITYRTPQDYIKILTELDLQFLFGNNFRLYHEPQFIAYGLYHNILGIHSIEYQGMGCGLINEDGVFEICDQNSHQFNTMQPIHVTKNMALQAHYNATVTYSKVILQQPTNAPLFMASFPFWVGLTCDPNYGGATAYSLIAPGTTTPTMTITNIRLKPGKAYILIDDIPIPLSPPIIVGLGIESTLFHITSDTLKITIGIEASSMINVTIKDPTKSWEQTHSLHTILRAPFNEYT